MKLTEQQDRTKHACEQLLYNNKRLKPKRNQTACIESSRRVHYSSDEAIKSSRYNSVPTSEFQQLIKPLWPSGKASHS